MKKNGFIAMSLIYTFFLVFVAVIISILNFYLDNNLIMKKINRDIINNYNANTTSRYLTDLYFKNVLSVGDYINYQVNDSTYKNGKWQVLKADANNIYIVSSFAVSINQKTNYNDSFLNTNYASTFINPTIVESIQTLNSTDLWQGYSVTELPYSSNSSSLYNLGINYFVKNNNETNIVVVNCSCGSNYYYSAYLLYNNLKDWNNAVCNPNNLKISSISKCNAKYTAGSNNMPNNYLAGYRLVVKLKNNVILIGGQGNYDDPYRVGVKIS